MVMAQLSRHNRWSWPSYRSRINGPGRLAHTYMCTFLYTRPNTCLRGTPLHTASRRDGHMYVHMSAHMYINMSMHMSTRMSIHMSTHMSAHAWWVEAVICLHTCPQVCLHVCLHTYLPTCQPTFLHTLDGWRGRRRPR